MASSVDAKIVLSAQDRATAVISRVRSQLGGLEKSAATLVRSIGPLGGAVGGLLSVPVFVSFFKAATDGIDRLNDLKDATGASIENLSALEDVALRTGTSYESMSSALVKFNKVLSDAKPGEEAARVLESIGLNAEELRRIDPAEALVRTATALDKYSDRGNKARIVQALFGRSIQEVAPLLKDLAENGTLVAKVTTQEAEAAEKFNKQLFALEKSTTDIGRAIVSTMLPAMNAQIEKFREAWEEGDSFLRMMRALVKAWPSAKEQWAALGNPLGIGLDNLDIENLDIDARTKRLDALNARIKTLTELLGGDKLTDSRRSRLQAQLKGLEMQRDALRVPFEAGFVGGSYDLRPDAPDSSKDSDRAKEKARKEREQRERLEAEKKMFEQYVGWLDSRQEELDEADRARHEEDIKLAKQRLEAAEQQWQQHFDFIDQEQQQAIDDGAAFLSEKAGQLSTFYEQAARNIQDSLGDTIYDTLTGRFDSIGRKWGELIARMTSQALAANMAEKLFGKDLKGGGVLSGALSWLGSLFFHDGGVVGTGGIGRLVPAAAFADAPRMHSGGVMGLRADERPAILQLGEEVLTRGDPRHRMNRGAAGDTFNIVNTVHVGDGVSRAEVAVALATSNQELMRQIRLTSSRHGSLS